MVQYGRAVYRSLDQVRRRSTPNYSGRGSVGRMDGDDVSGRMECFVRRLNGRKRRRIIRDSVVNAAVEVMLEAGTACSFVGVTAAEVNCAVSGRSCAGKVPDALVSPV